MGRWQRQHGSAGPAMTQCVSPTLSMPPVQCADLGAIRMAYYEAGAKGARPSLILCHGFPETAFSWRHQIPVLSAAGWHVVAPDQRGYGMTSVPSAVSAYDAETLCGDYAALLDHLGADRGIFVGHDWGGAMVWQMAMRRPERVAGVISLNTPFQKRATVDPITIMRGRMGPDMYIAHFQTPGEPDAILSDTRRTLEYFFRRPPVGGPASLGYRERRSGSGSTFALVRDIAEYDPATDTRAPLLSDDELAIFVEAFERTGFTGGINWYRNITRNWETAAAYEHVISQPSLMVMADKDPWLPPSSAEGMEEIVPDLTKVLIHDCGHWSQQERPEQVNRVILDWLDRMTARGKL